MKKKTTVRRPTLMQCLRDPDIFGPMKLDGPTWSAWHVILKAAYGEKLSAKQVEVFKKLTARTTYNPPKGGWSVIAVIAARQCGKSEIGSVVTNYESLFPLVEAPNLRAILVAQSEDDLKSTLFAYTRLPYEKSPALKAAIDEDGTNTTTVMTLKSGVAIRALPCKPAAVRGPSAVVAVLDEPAHYRATDGNPLDAEIMAAAEPSLFTTKGKEWLLSSPYAEYGRMFELHRDYYGKDDPRVLVIQSDSITLNPTLDALALAEYERTNPDAAISEVHGKFRANLSKLIDPNALEACVATGTTMRPFVAGIKYYCFVDSASGTKGGDHFACAIAHVERGKVILDVVRWWVPPFSARVVVKEIAELVTSYCINSVHGDRHGKGYAAQEWEDNKVRFEETDADHSAIRNFLAVEGMINSQSVVLLDSPDLLRQFRVLDRVRSATGDRVDHPRGTHDDAACAVAGVAILARELGAKQTGFI